MTQPNRRSARLAMGLIVLACVLVAAIVPLTAASWQGDDAAEASAGQLDDHEAQSESMDDRTVGSEDPNSREVESEDLADHEARPENPNDLEVGSERLSDHEADSENLTDLPAAPADRGYESIEMPGLSSWEPTSDPAVQAAREDLIQAQKRAENARTVYGDMIRRNYPRGQERLDIVKERDASMRALEQAKAALEATGN